MNSNEKGKRGEREFAACLRELFPSLADTLRRGQQHSGSPESPDVVGLPGVHIEVKRVQALNLEAAMSQSVRDSGGLSVPIVAHRKNHRPWMVTVRLDDLRALARIVNRIEKGDAA